MPSLEFLPVSLDDHLPTVSACGIDNNLFKADAFWRPAYELGDAMLLSGFVAHRTYIEPGMTQERTSVRFPVLRIGRATSDLCAPHREQNQRLGKMGESRGRR